MKEPLVLLHGMTCDARLFTSQVAAFSSERPVMVIMRIGGNTKSDLAERVLFHAPSHFALAVLSMGGIITMGVIRQAHDRVTRPALMDTNPLADPPENAPVLEAQVERVIQGGLRAVKWDEMKPIYLVDGSDRDGNSGLCMDMAVALGSAELVDQTQALQGHPDQSETLRSTAVLSLALCGAEEPICSVARYEMMRDLIPGSWLTVIPGAGHLPTPEKPEKPTRR